MIRWTAIQELDGGRVLEIKSGSLAELSPPPAGESSRARYLGGSGVKGDPFRMFMPDIQNPMARLRQPGDNPHMLVTIVRKDGSRKQEDIGDHARLPGRLLFHEGESRGQKWAAKLVRINPDDSSAAEYHEV